MNFTASVDYVGEARYCQQEFNNRFINKLAFRAEDVVLDVGCGTGEETREIAKQVKSITGVDASEEMIAVAKKTNTSKNASFCTWDARTVGDNPEWKERFDKAVSFFVIHWFPDHIKAFDSILACLKPGGELLVIMVHDNGFLPQVNRFLKSHTKWAKYIQDKETTLHPWYHSFVETADVLITSGWTNIECDAQPTAAFNEQQAKLFMKTLFGQSSLIPEAMLEEYLEDLWQWTLTEFPEKSQPGYIRFTTRGIAIYARKATSKV